MEMTLERPAKETGISPEIFGIATLQNLNVRLYNFTANLLNSEVPQHHSFMANVYRDVKSSLECLCRLYLCEFRGCYRIGPIHFLARWHKRQPEPGLVWFL